MECKRICSPKTAIRLMMMLVLTISIWWLALPEHTDNSGYIENYHHQIQNIIDSARQLSSISIFSQSDNFALQNLHRTGDDFSQLLSVQVESGMDEPVTTLESPVLWIGSLLGALYLTYILLQDRQNGLWPVICSTAQGRMHLALHRAGALALTSLLYHVLVYGCALSAGLIHYGGWHDLDRSVQSISQFSQVIWRTTVWQFAVADSLLRWLAVFCICLLVWLCFTLLQNIVASLAATGSFMALGWCLENWFPLSGSATIWRHINFWSAVHTADHLSVYENVPFFSKIASATSLRLAALGVYILLLLGLCLLSGLQRSGQCKRNRFAPLSRLRSKFVMRLSLFGKMVYQIMVIEHGLLFTILGMILLVQWLDLSPASYLPEEYLCQEFYLEYGADRQAADRQLDILRQQLDAEANRFAAASPDDESALLRYQALDTQRNMVELLTGQQQYLQTQEDDSLPYLNTRGYEELCETFYQGSFSCAVLLIVILIASRTFQPEKSTAVRSLLQATSKGNRGVIQQKLLALLGSIAVVWLAAGIMELLLIWQLYGLSGWMAPAQSVPLFSGVHTPLWLWLTWLYLRKLLIALSAGIITALFSIYLPTMVTIPMCSVLLVAFPPVREAMCLNSVNMAAIALPLIGLAVAFSLDKIWMRRFLYGTHMHPSCKTIRR